MRRTLLSLAVVMLCASPGWAASVRGTKAAAKTAAPKVEPKQEERMVTGRGTTYIQMEGSDVNGQPNKSGSVYLMDRADLPAKSMVRQRSSFRDQIVRDVLSR